MNSLKKLLVAVLLCTTVVFTASACGEEFTDSYATLLSPTVTQEEYNVYFWNPVEQATGYVVEINGETKGIGNPIIETFQYGNYCEYILDTESLGLGVHTVRFASYKFDAKKGTTLSDWTKEFYVVNELPKAMDSISVIGNEVYLSGVMGNTVELVFNDEIVATYTSPDKLPIGTTNIKLDKFTFSAELVDMVNYDVKAYVINSFGKSENYCSTQFKCINESKISPSLGVLENGIVSFYLEQEIVNPLVKLKINDTEYVVALTGRFVKIELGELIDSLEISDVKTVYQTLVKQDCEISLNVLSAEGKSEESGYSNVTTVKAGGQELVDIWAMNGIATLDGDYLLISASPISGIDEEAVTIKATVTLDDGTVQEIPVIQESGIVKVYDFASALGFGFNVIKVEQEVNFAELTSTAEIFYYVMSINSQVKSVSLGGNRLSWVSNGFNDGYKVKILNASGIEMGVYETTSNYWDVAEYQGNGSFSATIIPVLNDKEGTASPTLKINRVSMISASVIKEDAENLIIEGEDSNTISVEVYKTNGEAMLVYSQTLLSSVDVVMLSKTSLYGYGTFEIRLKKLGNGINTVDSNETTIKFAVSDCLTFDVKDGEYVKVSGLDKKLLVANDETIDSRYFSEDWFAIKEYYLDELAGGTANGNVVLGGKMGTLSQSTINILVKSLTFNMNSGSCIAPSPSYIVYDNSSNQITWSGSLESEYIYEIIDAVSSSVKSSGTITGPKLSVASLTKGIYTIKIKLVGNGQVLNSYWTQFDYEVLGSSTISTKTDVVNNKTKLIVKTASDNVTPVLYRTKGSYATYPMYVGENKNEYYFLLNSSLVSYAPYLTYEYNYDLCDYHSDIETISKELDLVSYQIYYYDAYDGVGAYKSFFRLSTETESQNFLLPVLETNMEGKYVLSTALVKDVGTGDYDYRYDYLTDSSIYPSGTVSFGDLEAFLITINYDNATGYEGVETSKYYTSETQEKVKIDYVYVYSKTNLSTYLATNVPLPSGYAYYSDAECTQLLDITEITSATTVYVGVAQA